MNKLFTGFFILTMMLGMSCKKDKVNTYTPIPYVVVNRSIYIDNPQYIALSNQGGYVYLDNEGARGIIVVHDYNDDFYALDRNCPYKPSDACAKVSMETSGLSLRCGHYDNPTTWVACCNSKFSLDGNLLEGPAIYPLKRYQVVKDGNMLTITN